MIILQFFFGLGKVIVLFIGLVIGFILSAPISIFQLFAEFGGCQHIDETATEWFIGWWVDIFD